METKYQEVEAVLEKHIRPRLKEHGGSIRLLQIEDRTAYVKLGGHCSGCPSAKYTVEGLVQEELLKHTDVVESVRIQEEVSPELYDFAKMLLSGGS